MAGLYFTHVDVRPKPPLANCGLTQWWTPCRSPCSSPSAGDGVAAFTNSTAGSSLPASTCRSLGALRQLRGHLAAAVRDGDDGALRVVAAELRESCFHEMPPSGATTAGCPAHFGDDLHEGRIACVVAISSMSFASVGAGIGDAFLHLDPVARRMHRRLTAQCRRRTPSSPATLLPCVRRRDGRREAGTAAAHHYDIGRCGSSVCAGVTLSRFLNRSTSGRPGQARPRRR